MKNFIKLFIAISCLIYFDASAQNLTNGEYFFDTDPGVGNGIALASFAPSDTINTNLSISTTGLSAGFHNLFIRYKDVNNNWGIYEGRSFYISPPNTAPPLAGNITNAEYFYNTDPGVGNGIALPSFSASDTINSNLSLSTTGLSTGFHNLFIRYKDVNNKWGIYEGRNFYVSPTNVAPPLAGNITNAEYFYDTDPGVGNGIALAAFTPSDTINSNLNISASGLSVGMHNLFIRYKDANNKWGIYEGREFEVVVCTIPDAAFSVSSLNVCLGDTVFVTDNSSNIVTATTYAWDYGNNGSIESTTAGNKTVYFNTVGAHAIKLVLNHLGCKDSLIMTVNVVQGYNLTNTANVCSGSSFTFADGFTQNNVTTSISHTNNLQSVFGCDSIVVTTLSVKPKYNQANSASVCSGASYTFADGFTQNNITSTTSHTNNLLSKNGCDSIVITTVSLYPNYNATVNASVCSGSNFTFPDGSTQNNITAPVLHTNTFQSIHGCDSIVITSLSINPKYNITSTVGVCTGSSFTFPDGFVQNNITASVSHTSNILSVSGCDSIVVTNVSVTSSYNFSETYFVCSGSSYTFPDGSTQNNITAQVVHNSTLTGVGTCDTIMQTTINVKPTYNITETKKVCSGSNYTFGDGTVSNNITSTVSHTSNLQSIFGCDSIVNTTVNVNPVFNLTATVNLCSGSSYTFPDGSTQNNITVQVVHTSHFQTVNSCDSNIVTTIKVNPKYNINQTASVCTGGSYTFPDGSTQNNITTTVNHISNLQTVNNCDSIINTTVNATTTYNTTESASVCSGGSYTFPDGTVQNNIVSTVSHTSNIASATACDTVIVSTISVNPVYSQNETIKVCSGSNYTLPDGTVLTNITANSNHVSSFTSTFGCDSIINTQIEIDVLTVNVSQANNTLNTTNTNGQYQWMNCETNLDITGATNSSFTPTETGKYKLRFTNTNGCIFYSECIDFVKVGIKDNLEFANIKVYPNPIIDNLFIEFENQNALIEIKDLTGKLVYTNQYKGKTLAVSMKEYSSGLYFVNVILDNKVQTFKVIKK